MDKFEENRLKRLKMEVKISRLQTRHGLIVLLFFGCLFFGIVYFLKIQPDLFFDRPVNTQDFFRLKVCIGGCIFALVRMKMLKSRICNLQADNEKQITSNYIDASLNMRDFYDEHYKTYYEEQSRQSQNERDYWRMKAERAEYEARNASCNTSYFDDCEDLQSLKSRYKALCKGFHSDLSFGNDEKMKQINAEFERKKKELERS